MGREGLEQQRIAGLGAGSVESGARMIDTGEGQTWADALLADNRSLKFLTEAELHGPFIIEKIAQWHGCTLAEARDRRGVECLRRLTTTDYARG